MTDFPHNDRTDSLLSNLRIESPQAEEQYSAQHSLERLMSRIHNETSATIRPIRNTAKIYRNWLAAATVAVIVLATGWLSATLRPAPEMIIRNNAWQKVEALTLADGTQLTLNRGTQLIFPKRFDGKTREIFLSGEAYFNVAHDKKHPFIVRVGDLKIKVLGTKFNVDADPSSQTITTTLLEGSIEVESQFSRQRIRMTPNQQLAYNTQSGEIKLCNISDSNASVRWKDNIWVLRQTPFTQMCHRLEQMFNIKIVIMSDQLATKKFTGEFRYGDSLESILEVIQITTPFTYQRNGDTIILK